MFVVPANLNVCGDECMVPQDTSRSRTVHVKLHRPKRAHGDSFLIDTAVQAFSCVSITRQQPEAGRARPRGYKNNIALV